MLKAWFLQAFGNYLLSTYHGTGTLLGARSIEQTRFDLCLQEVHSQVGE